MPNQRLAFAHRLREILPRLGIAEGRGEQTALGKMFGHSQQAARQWLLGETMPAPDIIARMAAKAAVELQWLQFGRGPKEITLREKLKDLVRAAEPLADYQIDQLIKIVPALGQPPEPDGADDSSSQVHPPKPRRQGR